MLKINFFTASWENKKSKEVQQEFLKEMTETEMMLKGYGLTTAEFFYHARLRACPEFLHLAGL